jgi:hypothetical protein
MTMANELSMRQPAGTTPDRVHAVIGSRLTPTVGRPLAAPAAAEEAALPFTGVPAGALSLLAFLMTAMGTALCVVARHQRRPSRR